MTFAACAASADSPDAPVKACGAPFAAVVFGAAVFGAALPAVAAGVCAAVLFLTGPASTGQELPPNPVL
jgi:hypothetical protein